VDGLTAGREEVGFGDAYVRTHRSLPFAAAVSTIRSVYSYATTRAGHVLVEPNFNDGSQEKNNWRLPWGLRTGLELRAQTLPFLQPHVIFPKMSDVITEAIIAKILRTAPLVCLIALSRLGSRG
jgi:hypothetical protein